MENLAGTVELREAIEQTQDALEDSREEAQRTRVEAAENAQSRNRLQSQARCCKTRVCRLLPCSCSVE